MSEIPEWASALPEALHDVPYLKGADTPEKFKEQLINAAQWQGNSIRIPGPDAGDEDIDNFRSRVIEKIPGLMPVPKLDDPDQFAQIMGKLGRPETADKYQAPEGTELEGEALGAIKAQAHALNLTQSQFAAYVSSLTTEQQQTIEQQQSYLSEQKEVIKGEWGAAFEERMNSIGAFLRNDKDTPEDILNAFDSGQMNAEGLRWLHKVSKLADEPNEAGAQKGTGSSVMTPSEAVEQLAEVENRLFQGENGRQMSPSNPMYQALVDKRMALMKMAYPG